LAGVGNIGSKGEVNFLIVDTNSVTSAIENVFKEMTTSKNIGILLITQKVYN
jgi:vacuolar-type H+-ATPase subunit F/Vma7